MRGFRIILIKCSHFGGKIKKKSVNIKCSLFENKSPPLPPMLDFTAFSGLEKKIEN